MIIRSAKVSSLKMLRSSSLLLVDAGVARSPAWWCCCCCVMDMPVVTVVAADGARIPTRRDSRPERWPAAPAEVEVGDTLTSGRPLGVLDTLLPSCKPAPRRACVAQLPAAQPKWRSPLPRRESRSQKHLRVSPHHHSTKHAPSTQRRAPGLCARFKHQDTLCPPLAHEAAIGPGEQNSEIHPLNSSQSLEFFHPARIRDAQVTLRPCSSHKVTGGAWRTQARKLPTTTQHSRPRALAVR